MDIRNAEYLKRLKEYRGYIKNFYRWNGISKRQIHLLTTACCGVNNQQMYAYCYMHEMTNMISATSTKHSVRLMDATDQHIIVNFLRLVFDPTTLRFKVYHTFGDKRVPMLPLNEYIWYFEKAMKDGAIDPNGVVWTTSVKSAYPIEKHPYQVYEVYTWKPMSNLTNIETSAFDPHYKCYHKLYVTPMSSESIVTATIVQARALDQLLDSSRPIPREVKLPPDGENTIWCIPKPGTDPNSWTAFRPMTSSAKQG